MDFKIGDIQICWQENNYPLKLDEYMEKFLYQGYENNSIVYTTEYVNLKDMINGTLIEKNGLYELYQIDNRKFIVYHWAQCRFAFGFWIDDLSQNKEMVYYFDHAILNEIPLDAVRFFSCSGLHTKLLQYDALILHSSYIDWNGKALLFCGKSGIGKSTQAKLWSEIEDAAIVNGDRTLLRKKDDQWYAYGYPCCGSSLICENRTLPIYAIILLDQGNENSIIHLSKAQKMAALIAGSERYLWSEDEFEKIYALSNSIINEVPVIKFICRKDESAVCYLKSYLMGGIEIDEYF